MASGQKLLAIFIKFLSVSETFRDLFFQLIKGENMTTETELTMSVHGKIVREVTDGIFEVKTRLGFALVWFDEELCLDPRVGDEFQVDDGSVVFWDGYVVSNMTKNGTFWLNKNRYEIVTSEESARRILAKR